ncbi:MAG: hypothetical protein RIB86_18535 [Imperialibacter sp.]
MSTEPARISPELFEHLIRREFGGLSNEVTDLLQLVNSDSESGKRRIGTAILKLANKNVSRLEQLIKRANSDFWEIVAEAEYPRAFEAGLTEQEKQYLKAYGSHGTPFDILKEIKSC